MTAMVEWYALLSKRLYIQYLVEELKDTTQIIVQITKT